MKNKNNLKKIKCVLITNIAISIVFIFVVIMTYFSKFNGDFSSNSSAWGTFGDYLGGTLNPILAFMTLMTIIITTWIQHNELINVKKENKKNEIIGFIQLLIEDSNSMLKSIITINQTQVKLIDITSLNSQLENSVKSLDQNTKDRIENLLSSLSEFFKILDLLTEQNSISSYYRKKIYQEYHNIKLITEFNTLMKDFEA